MTFPKINGESNETQATELINQGNLREAEEIYRLLISKGTKDPVIFSNLAAICGMTRRKDEMIELLRISLELNPDFPEANFNLANALKEKGNLQECIIYLKKALSLKPNFAEANNHLGNIYQEQGRLDSAINCFEKALSSKSDYSDASYNLGNAYQIQGQHTLAIKNYQIALRSQLNCQQIHNNLGTSFQALGDLSNAIKSYRKSIQLEQNNPQAHNNLGNVLQELGDFQAAISFYRKAIELNPFDSDTRRNLSHALLRLGQYKEGWEEYEHRSKANTAPSKPHAFSKEKLWDGGQLQPNEKLLIISEQGLGDTLHFMRYLITLRKKNIDIILCAQNSLHDLIRESGIHPNPITTDQANEFRGGKWIPLLSIPKNLGITPENPIITKPYISSSISLRKKWEKILSSEERPIIGLNWQGNPAYEVTNGKGRSFALEACSSFITNNNLNLLSLQKDFGSEQLDKCSFRDNFVKCQSEINQAYNFLEVSAIIDNCDLIITCDSVIGHLAGGMGKNTWLLLKTLPSWRWGMQKETTFWYPSVKLFRQRDNGNWDDVMQQIAKESRDHFSLTLENHEITKITK